MLERRVSIKGKTLLALLSSRSTTQIRGRIWAFVMSEHHLYLFTEYRPVLGVICLTVLFLPVFVSRAQMPPCLSKSIPSMAKVTSTSHLRVSMTLSLASTTLLGLSFMNQKVSLSLLDMEGEDKGMTCLGCVTLQSSVDLKSDQGVRSITLN